MVINDYKLADQLDEHRLKSKIQDLLELLEAFELGLEVEVFFAPL